jgi:hypothetical protein
MDYERRASMRTNDFLKSFPPHEHSWQGKVTISFGYPEHGWIQMTVTCTAYVQGVIVALSAAFDPFPEIIRWLKDIAAGKLPSEFIVDEEEYGKVFRASPVNEEEFIFEIAEWLWNKKGVQEPLYMYVRVSKQQFLSEFLRQWDELIKEKYDPSHWQESSIDLRTLDVSKIRTIVEK